MRPIDEVPSPDSSRPVEPDVCEPNFAVTTSVTPCTHNVLGVKGCGEAGAVGAPPAVINAVVDALSGYGVDDIPMPATPQRVWQAMQSAANQE